MVKFRSTLVILFCYGVGMRQFRATPENQDVTKGIGRFNKLSRQEKRAYVVQFVDRKYAHKPENYRKVVVRNMLRDMF